LHALPYVSRLVLMFCCSLLRMQPFHARARTGINCCVQTVMLHICGLQDGSTGLDVPAPPPSPYLAELVLPPPQSAPAHAALRGTDVSQAPDTTSDGLTRVHSVLVLAQ
jgi:hypothetical protein